MHLLTGDGLERVADRAGGADHHEAGLFEHPGNVEGDEELILDHENPCCCHLSRLPASPGRAMHQFI